MSKLIMGTVSCDPHPKSGYVRVESPQYDSDCPLSLKASLNGFGHCDVSKGDIVTVERTSGGYKGWKLLKVNKVQDTEVPPSKASVTIKVTKVTTDDPDRVRFFLPKMYFQTRVTFKGMSKNTCLSILCLAFDMTLAESEHLMRVYPDGFSIVCRPDQFADFIIRRNDAGECINGIKDLDPKYVKSSSIDDPYDCIARCTDVSRDDVKRVLQAANCDGRLLTSTNEIQVWRR